MSTFVVRMDSKKEKNLSMLNMLFCRLWPSVFPGLLREKIVLHSSSKNRKCMSWLLAMSFGKRIWEKIQNGFVRLFPRNCMHFSEFYSHISDYFLHISHCPIDERTKSPNSCVGIVFRSEIAVELTFSLNDHGNDISPGDIDFRQRIATKFDVTNVASSLQIW